jgi:two-component system chemotaxis response regulator CheV
MDFKMGLSKIEQITSSHLRNEVQFFEFEIEGVKTKFATNVFKIKEIIKYEGKIVDIFSDVDYLVGAVDIRHVTIPVMDLGVWLSGKSSNSNLFMICDFLNVLVAVMISKPIGIKTISWDKFTRSDSEKIIGYFKDNGEIIEIVDLEKMIVEAFPEIEHHGEIEEVGEIKADKLILVADDSKMVLKTLSKILEKMGLKYKTFPNGEELLNYLFSISPDEVFAVITDLEMPQKSGFEVIKEIKNSKEYSKIPIIVNSTMSGESNEEMAKSLNADGFVSKNKPKEIEFYLKKFLNL